MASQPANEIRALLARQRALNLRQQQRLARKIHDGLSQKLTLLTLQLSLASSEDSPPENWGGSCKEWSSLVMEIGQGIREVINELQPRIQDDLGLSAALRAFAQSAPKGIRCCFIPPSADISMEPFAACELLGICREVITDILKPAELARVEIELEQKDGMVRLHLRVKGNEPGRESPTQAALDAIALEDRLLCLEGTAELRHSADGGSVLILTVPATDSTLRVKP